MEITLTPAQFQRQTIKAMSDTEVLEGLERNGKRAFSTVGEVGRSYCQLAMDYKNEALNRRIV